MRTSPSSIQRKWPTANTRFPTKLRLSCPHAVVEEFRQTWSSVFGSGRLCAMSGASPSPKAASATAIVDGFVDRSAREISPAPIARRPTTSSGKASHTKRIFVVIPSPKRNEARISAAPPRRSHQRLKASSPPSASGSMGTVQFAPPRLHHTNAGALPQRSTASAAARGPNQSYPRRKSRKSATPPTTSWLERRLSTEGPDTAKAARLVYTVVGPMCGCTISGRSGPNNRVESAQDGVFR